jgi:hypothetical protein
MKLYEVEANPFGIKFPKIAGLFFEDELKFEKEAWMDWHWYIKKAFESCDFMYADEEQMIEVCKVTGNEVCPFHCYNFDWSYDTYYLIAQ